MRIGEVLLCLVDAFGEGILIMVKGTDWGKE